MKSEKEKKKEGIAQHDKIKEWNWVLSLGPSQK